MNGFDALVCLSNKVTASSVFAVGEPLFVAVEETRIVFEALLIRMGLFSCEVDRRVKNDEESGERLVPVEFGGVRCLFGLSSVFKEEKHIPTKGNALKPYHLPTKRSRSWSRGCCCSK
jgi:predicted ATP-dependent Lon-type protease